MSLLILIIYIIRHFCFSLVLKNTISSCSLKLTHSATVACSDLRKVGRLYNNLSEPLLSSSFSHFFFSLLLDMEMLLVFILFSWGKLHIASVGAWKALYFLDCGHKKIAPTFFLTSSVCRRWQEDVSKFLTFAPHSSLEVGHSVWRRASASRPLKVFWLFYAPIVCCVGA